MTSATQQTSANTIASITNAATSRRSGGAHRFGQHRLTERKTEYSCEDGVHAVSLLHPDLGEPCVQWRRQRAHFGDPLARVWTS